MSTVFGVIGRFKIWVVIGVMSAMIVSATAGMIMTTAWVSLSSDVEKSAVEAQTTMLKATIAVFEKFAPGMKIERRAGEIKRIAMEVVPSLGSSQKTENKAR